MEYSDHKPPDQPSRALIHLLQVFQWGVNSVGLSARLLIVAITLSAVILTLRAFLLAFECG